MFQAVDNNGFNLSELMSFLNQWANPGARDEEEKTLLHHYLTPKALRYLLRLRIIDPNAQNIDGNTPLHEAADLTTVRALIRAGANPFITNNAGQTPREIFEELNNPEYANLIAFLRNAENAVF
ncbi:MAG: ankyrin repeat domain-containing protein [Puniceicoccales bacterium]|jgi:ankyrin repeat protein|nr:ankyrin repeat domain-containing protein [Puniceicoccales bacterium]